LTLATSIAFTVPGPAGSTTPFCRSCGQVCPPAGDAPPSCPACGTGRSGPADERHSRIGRTFTYRTGLSTRTGVAVAEDSDVVVVLDVDRNRLDEVEPKRLRDAAGADPLGDLISPAYRLAVIARAHPAGAHLLLQRSQELLHSTAARRAYAVCALDRGDDEGLAGAGLSPLEVAWLRLWHHHRTRSPAGALLFCLDDLPVGGFPDKLAVIAAAHGALGAEPVGRPPSPGSSSTGGWARSSIRPSTPSSGASTTWACPPAPSTTCSWWAARA
jgi:hypothetical protein